VRQTAREIQSEVVPGVEKLGFSAITAAMKFGGLATAMAAAAAGSKLAFGFQATAQNLTRMREATGLSIDALRTFEALGPRVGASSEQMDAGLRSLTDKMEQMKRFPQAARGRNARRWVYA
jgi:hypothetical protein